MKWFKFWKKNNSNDDKSTYWIISKYRDRSTGKYTDDWRMETLNYRKFHKGDRPSRIKLYAEGKLVFDGSFKELIDIIKEHNKTN